MRKKDTHQPRLLEAHRFVAAVILVVAGATILAALFSEYVLGMQPCLLCLYQRWPYYAAVPLAALVVLFATGSGIARTGLALLGLIFTASALLAAYHAGVEWGLFLGPTGCGGAAAPTAASMEDFMRQLEIRPRRQLHRARLRLSRPVDGRLERGRFRPARGPRLRLGGDSGSPGFADPLTSNRSTKENTVARSRKEEERFLSKDEQEFVARSHHPDVRELSDSDLSDLVSRLRERRDRARDIAQKQRREMRGKSAPSGAKPSADDTGSRQKAAIIAAALKRVSKEGERRRETKDATRVG